MQKDQNISSKTIMQEREVRSEEIYIKIIFFFTFHNIYVKINMIVAKTISSQQ